MTASLAKCYLTRMSTLKEIAKPADIVYSAAVKTGANGISLHPEKKLKLKPEMLSFEDGSKLFTAVNTALRGAGLTDGANAADPLRFLTGVDTMPASGHASGAHASPREKASGGSDEPANDPHVKCVCVVIPDPVAGTQTVMACWCE